MASNDLYVVYRDHFYHPGEGAKIDAYGYTQDTPEALKVARKNASGELTILARGVTAMWAKKIVAALYEGEAMANPRGRRRRNPPSGGGTMTITKAERDGWVKLAQDAYRTGRNFYGHRFSAMATKTSLPVQVYDTLQVIYRRWLIGGWKNVESGGESPNPRGRRGRIKDNPFVTILNPRGKKLKDFPITLIGDPGHAEAQRETVRRLTRGRVDPGLSETAMWRTVQQFSEAMLKHSGDLPRKTLATWAERLKVTADLALEQLGRGVHHNPPMPAVSHDMGAVTEIRYIHAADGDRYKHTFPKREGRPHLMALKDGSLHIWSPRGRVL